ncbi:MAG TPA: hypothetical protein PLB89_18180 [Flavobacteriales bacterium]|nr:hypothetical protein [Flavobacteriales bacterium]
MDQEIERVHQNHKQLEVALIKAQHTTLIWSRRTGKTDGPMAQFSADNCFDMPGSLGGFVAPSYRKMLTQFMASLKTGWSRIGYEPGRDYLLGKPNKKWEMPIHSPQEWSTAIHFRCGSAITLMSQDRPGSANGNTLYWLGMDEKRYLKRATLDEEVLPALSGNPPLFRHLSCHKSTMSVTDRPRTASTKYILDDKEAMDTDTVETIMEIQVEIQLLQQAIRTGAVSPKSARVYASRIQWYQEQLNQLRMGLTFYSEASTVDNWEVVGLDYLLEQKRKLGHREFLISIMNRDMDYVEGGFYPKLDEDKHAFTPAIASYTTNFDLTNSSELVDDDCRHDAELVGALPLRIAGDYGSSFNCINTGQRIDRLVRYDNEHFMRSPHKTAEVCRMWSKYFKHHPCKDVIYYFDHTAIGTDGKSDLTYAEIVISTLTEEGWNVIPVYIGKAPDHYLKFNLWVQVCDETPASGGVYVQFNAENTKFTLGSMKRADVKQTKGRFEKNKDDERNKEIDQALTTHLSDSADTLLWGCYYFEDPDHGVPDGMPG